MNVSVCVPAFNEEANIANLIRRLEAQQLPKKVRLAGITVVASGCTDDTVEIVRGLSRKNRKIKLLIQKRREGKASAINLFLNRARSGIIVIISADTQPTTSTIAELVKPFDDPEVGLSAGRPVPLNSPKNFTGFVVNLIWTLHHCISLEAPKAGEMIAFRNFIKSIPKRTATDECSVEAITHANGYKIAYAPKATVFMKGPDNLSELIAQRKRIYIGHLRAKRESGYEVSTMSVSRIARHFFHATGRSPQKIFWGVAAGLLEFLIRIAALIDYHFHDANPYKWSAARTTKNLRVKK